MQILAWAGAWVGLFVLIYGMGLAIGRIGELDELTVRVLADSGRRFEHLPPDARERAARRLVEVCDLVFAATGAASILVVTWLLYGH